MKAPLSATEKVQRFLARVPDADAATIAKAKGLSVDEVLGALLILQGAQTAPPEIRAISQRQLMTAGFESFKAAAGACADLRPPARCTSALATLHEMEDLFKQLLGELGEEA